MTKLGQKRYWHQFEPAPEFVVMFLGDEGLFRAALDRTLRKLRLVVLSETPNAVVLGPKWTLVRLRLQQVRIAFADGEVTVNAPALPRICTTLCCRD